MLRGYGSSTLVADFAAAIDGLIAERMRTTASTAFDGLTVDQREAISLCRMAGMTASQAGAVMDRSEDAVRKLLGRGLFRLGKLLDCGQR